MSAPTPPPPDGKDWTWVLQRPCPDCGYDATAVTLGDLPGAVEPVITLFEALLAEPGAATRPEPEVWSALEYACHVRDVARIFAGRLTRLLTEDDPQFANWDQDETALERRYWAQDPAAVAAELRPAATHIAAAFAAVPPEALPRPGRRSDGAVFTVDTLGRYFLHDLVHHASDVRTAAPTG